MTKIVKSCSTCEHRQLMGTPYDRCALSGFQCVVERKYPTECGENFDGWVKRLGVFERIRFWVIG